jgi:hypothetical protein
MKIFHIGVLLLVLATGCKKSNIENTAAQGQFPNQIGDKWRYLVIDTTVHVNQDSSFTQYYVDVIIVDTVKIQNGITATLWQLNYPDHTDTNYVYLSGDTIKFVDRYGWNLLGQYIFPFTSGSFWEYVPSLPAIPQYVTVTGPADITVSNNTFLGAWRIYGFVKKYFNPYGYFNTIRHNLDWSLVSYQLK